MRSLLSVTALLVTLSTASAQSPIVGWNLRGADAVFTSDTSTFVASYVQTVAPAALPLYGIDWDASATTLWAIDNVTFEYGTLEPATGAFTVVGVSNMPGITGLTASPDGTTWYASDYDGVANTQLYVGDVTTGVFTLVGDIGAGIHIDIAMDSNGNLYSHSISDDTLYSVNTTTGMGTALPNATGFAANFAQGMDFDWTDDTLYATIYTGGGTGMFCSFDLTTGLPATMEDTVGLNAEMEMAIQVAAPSDGPLGTLDTACNALPNSSGLAAAIELIGTGNAGDPIAGTATQGPADQFGYFISGPNPGLYITPPGSSGIICIGNPQFRYDSVPAGQVFQFDAAGISDRVVGDGPSDLPTDGSYAPVPAVLAGESRAFQAWYRDGMTSNFSESKIVTFQ
ncbi:MAG: hypothetical protein GY711_20430 [bacterium]|nr:hypothetical protein [bacterium]